MNRVLLAILGLIAFGASQVRATGIETLPAGVRMTQTRMGVISGLDQTWQSNGKLYELGDVKSISFDAATLARVEPRAQQLIDSLNYFGRQDLGSKINLGTLNVDTKPQLQYFAPVFAYGINERWTLGVGFPVIRYSNRVSLSQSQSNLDVYRQLFTGISPRLDEALNTNLAQRAHEIIAAKGYRPIESRNEQFIGDTEVGLLHKLSDLGSWRFLHQLTFRLPTGPKDDPDDLLAVNAFGRRAIENTLVAGKSLGSRLMLLPYTTVAIALPDKVTKRVPTNEDDNLPDAETKQDVTRQIAPSFSLGTELRWDFADAWSTAGSVEGSIKGQDTYSGRGRMDLLSVGSDSSVAKVKGSLTYSTVEAFQAGRSKVPTRFALNVSDTIAGRNTERQLVTELSAILFF